MTQQTTTPEPDALTNELMNRMEATLVDFRWLAGHLMVAKSGDGHAVIPAHDLEAVGQSMQATYGFLLKLVTHTGGKSNTAFQTLLERMRSRREQTEQALAKQQELANAALSGAAPFGGQSGPLPTDSSQKTGGTP